MPPLQRLLRKAYDWLAIRGATNPRLASIYYSLVSRSYWRDQQAFLAGLLAYENSLLAPKGTMASLRRNIHRLEKGIIMRPRRNPFALDYIEETIAAYQVAAHHEVDPIELSWATDVLDEYFRLCGEDPQVASLQPRYLTARSAPGATGTMIPYQRAVSRDLLPDDAALMHLAKHRRSVRWFLPKSVPREKIERAIEIGGQAPSACNRQPFVFRIIDEPTLVQEVLSIPYGTVGYSHNVPVVAVIVGQQRHFFSERDRHLIYVDASLAAMGTLLALESMGISTCCINWPDIAELEDRMATTLHLALDERPVMLIAIGYADPDGLVPHSQKKSGSQIIRYNLQ
jgi:nitroreductase